jgi:choline kinase
MIAVMLAAGTGSRLSGSDESHPPKSLLRFDGRSLLERHVEILRAHGAEALVLVVGYRAAEIEAEIRAIDAADFVHFVHNPDYRRGSLVSMWCARDVLTSAGELLFMDADVLYDPAILARMAEPAGAACLPYDRGFEDGAEPVKLCIERGRAVEFRKDVGDVAYDDVGEWIGFIRATPAFAAALAAACEKFVGAGRMDDPCEEAIREVLLTGSGGPVAFADVTGLPWIEIDFPEDVTRAAEEILPAIEGR